MDPNLYQSPSLDGSMNMSGSDPLNMSTNNLNVLTTEQLIQLQQINQQQIQQLQAQLAQAQLAGTQMVSSPYATTFQGVSPTAPIAVNSGPLYSPNAQSSPIINPNFVPAFPLASNMPPGTGPIPLNASMNISLNGQVQATPQANLNTSAYNQVTYPNPSTGINSQLSNQIHVQVANQADQNRGPARFVATPNTLQLQQVNQPRDASLSSSSYSSSAPSTPLDSPAASKKPQQNASSVPDVPMFMQRPRQQITSPLSVRPPPAQPASDRSSTSSSVPGSPGSSGNPPFSPDGSLSDSFGPISPEGTPKKGINGEIKVPGSQIKNKPLQMETRHPQDKCYSCMKKVYPMEKLGPVRGVVFHKGCFKCKTCNTSLNIKNFVHNQSDQYDKSVYCKSHQPLSTEKGPKLDADSFEIKSALNAPKKAVVTPESERVPVHKYSYDVTSKEIEHARRAPVTDLQSGVKTRNQAWSKSKREHFNSMPTNLVKHDEQVPEYDLDEYNRHIIETQPDY